MHLPIEKGGQNRAVERLNRKHNQILRKIEEINKLFKKSEMTDEETIYHEGRFHYYEEQLDIVRNKIKSLKSNVTNKELFLPALYIS